jgi:hypothetical protein
MEGINTQTKCPSVPTLPRRVLDSLLRMQVIKRGNHSLRGGASCASLITFHHVSQASLKANNNAATDQFAVLTEVTHLVRRFINTLFAALYRNITKRTSGKLVSM